MNLPELKRLVREGEHLHLEFKRKANYPDKIIRELVAFANTDGGTLLIGVDDDGGIYGSKYPEEDVYAIQTSLERLVVPRLKIPTQRIRITASREVIAFLVRPSRRKPHFIKYEDHKQAYVRVRDMSVQASREVVSLLRYARGKRGVQFEVGENERKLLLLLEDTARTTLLDTQRKLNISRKKASELLVTMVRVGLLRFILQKKKIFLPWKKTPFQTKFRF